MHFSLSVLELSVGQQEAFEVFLRDHEYCLSIENNRAVLQQRSVCATVLLLLFIEMFSCTIWDTWVNVFCLYNVVCTALFHQLIFFFCNISVSRLRYSANHKDSWPIRAHLDSQNDELCKNRLLIERRSIEDKQ